MSFVLKVGETVIGNLENKTLEVTSKESLRQMEATYYYRRGFRFYFRNEQGETGWIQTDHPIPELKRGMKCKLKWR